MKSSPVMERRLMENPRLSLTEQAAADYLRAWNNGTLEPEKAPVEIPGIKEPGSSTDLPWPELVAELNRIHNLSDAIYSVRSRAGDDELWTGSLWDHPTVARYAELIKEINERLQAEGHQP